MSILFDVAAYSALRTRGNLKVARETALIQELGVFGYDRFKQQERVTKRSVRRKRTWTAIGLIAIAPFWLISIPLYIYLIVRKLRKS